MNNQPVYRNYERLNQNNGEWNQQQQNGIQTHWATSYRQADMNSDNNPNKNSNNNTNNLIRYGSIKKTKNMGKQQAVPSSSRTQPQKQQYSGAYQHQLLDRPQTNNKNMHKTNTIYNSNIHIITNTNQNSMLSSLAKNSRQNNNNNSGNRISNTKMNNSNNNNFSNINNINNNIHSFNKPDRNYQHQHQHKHQQNQHQDINQINRYFNNQSEQEDDGTLGQQIQLKLNHRHSQPQKAHAAPHSSRTPQSKQVYPFKPNISNIQSHPSIQVSMPNNSHESHVSNPKSRQIRYGQGGQNFLQFNPEKEKFIILDSKQTEGFPHVNNIGCNQFCEDFQVPLLEQVPSSQNNAEELVRIAKQGFIRLGCHVDDQTVINVRKYKNCVHFSISSDQNILYHYQNGKIYYGAWKNTSSGQGQKHGSGMEILPGKYKFKGVFSDGKKSGFGILRCFDGTAYVGQWENGMRHGSGKQLDQDGIIYEGQWKDGKKNGYGILQANGKVIFQGVFAKGLKNGYGKEYFQNGDCYDGNYANHKFQGKGTYYWKSGAVYTGDFKGGKRNGFGIWKSGGKNCDTYQGEYLQDKKHGKGLYTWFNGATYDGDFFDDLKHGVGTIKYQNGKVAHLNWKKGKVKKKVQKGQICQDEQHNPSFSRNNIFQSSRLKGQGYNNTHNSSLSQSKAGINFILRNITAARSTQNLNSARSSSTTNSHALAKGVTFHTKSANKFVKSGDAKPGLSNRKGEQQIIRLKFDNKQFEKAIGKSWNKNLLQAKKKEEKGQNRPQYPKDRPYQGIQFSNNMGMQF